MPELKMCCLGKDGNKHIFCQPVVWAELKFFCQVATHITQHIHEMGIVAMCCRRVANSRNGFPLRTPFRATSFTWQRDEEPDAA